MEKGTNARGQKSRGKRHAEREKRRVDDGDGNKDSEGQRGKKKEEGASKRDDNGDG